MDVGHRSSPPDPGPAPAVGQRTPWRAILLGLLLVPVNAFWLVQMEMATNQSAKVGGTAGPFPTTFSLFANAICFLVALSAGNGLLRRARPQAALTQAELLIVYVMITIGTCVTSVDFLPVLFPMLGHGTYYATPSNNWQELFLNRLPSWLRVTDLAALKPYYAGNANPYQWVFLRAWLLPVSLWSAFAIVLLLVMLCMNVLVRRQWTQNEKLSYPIIQLPMEMTDPTGAFYRSRLMWMGAGVAAAISLLNGLSIYVPSLPSVPVKVFDVSPFMVNRPWNAVGWTPVSLYPFAIGLGFLLPADLLFSCWFFYFYWKAQRVISSMYGWSDYNASFPYVNEQSFGAYMGIAVLALWGARHHLSRVIEQAFSPAPEPEPDQPFSYRTAVIGVVAGLTILMGFFCAAGLPLWMCAAGFAIYYLIAIACTRMRAELGPPAHDLHNGGPDYILTAVFGTRGFTPQTLGVLTFFYWFNRAYRSLAMPCQLEAFKMGERKGIASRWIAAAIVLATVVGVLSGSWALYQVGYRNGAEARMAGHYTYFGAEAFNRLQGWIQSPKGTDVPAVVAISGGFLLTLALQAARMRATWFPFHPLGMAVSGSYSMNTIWLPLVIAWICKVSILRYGGLPLYRRALYFFLGLILGDYVLGCAWPIVGWLVHSNAYSFQQ